MSHTEDGQAPETTTVEWVAAGVSAMLIILIVAVLLYDGLARPSTPPEVSVQVDSITGGSAEFHVYLRARNHGHTTAANLAVVGELRDDTVVVEQSHVTLDYVPAEGSRPAGLLFSRDPRHFSLAVRAVGYQLP